jgi:hypothetical protein
MYHSSSQLNQQLNNRTLTPDQLHDLAWKVYNDSKSTDAERAIALKAIRLARYLQTPNPNHYAGLEGAL